MIVTPKKVYLDFAIWIDFAEGRRDDRAFFALVDQGAIVPVLSFMHLLEMNVAEARDPVRRPGLVVARYFDRVLGPRRNNLLWVRAREFVRHDEIVFEAMRCSDLPTSHAAFEPFAGRLHEVLGEGAFDPNRSAIDSPSFVDMLGLSLANTPYGPYIAERAHEPARRRALRANRGHFKKLRIDRTEVIERWVVPELVRVRGLDPRVVRDRFDIARCPILSFVIAYNNGMNVSDSGERPSDVEDGFHLGGVAYADIAFIDKNVVDALRRGGLARTRLPRRIGDFDAWLAQENADGIASINGP